MQKDFSAHAAQTRADNAIDRYGVGPSRGIFIAQPAPHRVGMERAADTGAFGRRGIFVSLKPAQAIGARHALFDQRPAIDAPSLEARFHAGRFVK